MDVVHRPAALPRRCPIACRSRQANDRAAGLARLLHRYLAAAGVDEVERALIRGVLDSYQYTNALALVVLSALLAHYEPRPADALKPAGTAPKPSGAKIPELPPMDALDPEVAALVEELNAFGEDTEPQLIASMYRHLAYWPAYLALVRTMLAPLQREGSLNALTLSTRALGYAHGAVLAPQLKPGRRRIR